LESPSLLHPDFKKHDEKIKNSKIGNAQEDIESEMKSVLYDAISKMSFGQGKGAKARKTF